jgi:AcrR family transcriptional regulator
MPRSGNGGRYHHGDLRGALIDTAVELIGERGVREFSLAEASRRLGVAVSAPYADSAGRLAAMARGYIRFAASHRPLFEMLYEAGLDKVRHPEIEAAEQPLDDGPDPDPGAVELAAGRAARAILALVGGRRLLG